MFPAMDGCELVVKQTSKRVASVFYLGHMRIVVIRVMFNLHIYT